MQKNLNDWRNNNELLIVCVVWGNEECQDRNRRIYKTIFSFNRKSYDRLVGSPCILLIHPYIWVMMNKQVRLNLEDKVREFVGDFKTFFEELKKWSKDATEIITWRDHFLKEYPKISNGSSEVEMDADIDTTMRKRGETKKSWRKAVEQEN